MNPGPLPPHERTWRHPSELAAEQRSEAQSEGTASGTLRAVGLLGGTLGVLAIGLAALSITPTPGGERLEQAVPIGAAAPPVTASSTTVATTVTTTTVTTTSATGTAFSTSDIPPVSQPGATVASIGSATVVTTTSTTTTYTTVSSTSASSTAGVGPDRERAGEADVTIDPIGTSGLALVSTAETHVSNDQVELTMPDGQTYTVEPVASARQVALVALDPGLHPALAAALPGDDEMVYVVSDDATESLSFADLVDGAPSDAAFVTDEAGAIIGVCAKQAGTLTFIPFTGRDVDERISANPAIDAPAE